MKENALYEELLNDVSGGRVPTEDDFNDLLAAMEQADGKRCRCCNKVFSKNELYGHKSEILKICNDFVLYGRDKLPCYGCMTWRLISPDFIGS